MHFIESNRGPWRCFANSQRDHRVVDIFKLLNLSYAHIQSSTIALLLLVSDKLVGAR